jgi:hypothetical protein
MSVRFVRVRPAAFTLHGLFLGLGFLIAFALATPIPLYLAVGVAWVAWRHRRGA